MTTTTTMTMTIRVRVCHHPAEPRNHRRYTSSVEFPPEQQVIVEEQVRAAAALYDVFSPKGVFCISTSSFEDFVFGGGGVLVAVFMAHIIHERGSLESFIVSFGANQISIAALQIWLEKDLRPKNLEQFSHGSCS
jgi:hypothetical protein